MPHESTRRTLTDTGPIVAILDVNDKNHDRCWEAMQSLPADGILTPTACLVEALYLLGKAGGHALQHKLWTMIESSVLQLRPDSVGDCTRCGQLMAKYADIPMDFADGMLVVAAEALNVRTIFTLDRHFYAYRKSSGDAFTIFPG